MTAERDANAFHVTAQECAFVEGLGRWCGRLPRKKLLVLYRDSMIKRSRWGRVDPVAVRAVVDRLIAQEYVAS